MLGLLLKINVFSECSDIFLKKKKLYIRPLVGRESIFQTKNFNVYVPPPFHCKAVAAVKQKFVLTKILLLSEAYRRPRCLIEDSSETDMPARRPIRDWHAQPDTHRRPKCSIGDRHAPTETVMSLNTHQSPTCLRSSIEIYWKQMYLNLLIFTFCLLFVFELCKDSNQTCWSLVGLWLCMLVSNVCWSLIWHVGLKPNMSVSDGSSILVSDGPPIGLRY